MAQQKKPTPEELKSIVGKKGKEAVVGVDKSTVRLYCDCIGDTNPKWQTLAPPGLLCAAMFFGEGFPVEFPYSGVLDLGSDIEFRRSIAPGDIITTTTEFADIQDKSTDKARRVFLTFKSTHQNQRGDVVAVSTSRIMSFG
ncbi:MAG: MaoC family dehydratase N-terminal domain-containing protein [Chloroflexi bacterium]|nr:MaoC family dehydratase N-terminal domain-containing protein [Chloroflexota bacterium]